MKKCELCDSSAKMYCDSDQASLCWDCDANVHGANFLVAKHSRTLLCHLCQSHTPWTGSGPKLTPTVSVCENCVKNSSCREERSNGDDKDDDIDGADETEDDGEEEEGEEEEEENGDGDDEEENQVVPWSSTPPPSASSSSNLTSSDEGAIESRIAFSLKGSSRNSRPSCEFD